MYSELEKYKTGQIIPTKHGNNNTIYYNQYIAPLGDLIEDFVQHQQKPWWKRKYYHNHLTKLYKKFLNKMTVEHHLQV